MNKYINKPFKKDADHRFTTEEMEKSTTRFGFEFKITTLLFEDNKTQLPTKAIGSINTGQGWKIIATWNQFGECTLGGLRMFSFDLINSNQDKNDGVKPMIVTIG